MTGRFLVCLWGHITVCRCEAGGRSNLTPASSPPISRSETGGEKRGGRSPAYSRQAMTDFLLKKSQHNIRSLSGVPRIRSGRFHPYFRLSGGRFYLVFEALRLVRSHARPVVAGPPFLLVKCRNLDFFFSTCLDLP